VVGSGIFVLPAAVAIILGPASPVAYLMAAFLTALVVLCFAEGGSISALSLAGTLTYLLARQPSASR
jgi:basic amino acid/polyamine antiporter, APA family